MAAQSLGWDGETAESFDLRRRRRNPRVGKRVNLTLLLFLLALLLGVLEQGRRQGVEAHTALHACTATAGVGRGVATTAATTLTSTGFFLPRPTAQRDGGAPVNVKDAVLEANGTASEEEDGNVSSPHSEDPTPSLLAEAKAEAEAEESPPHSVNTTTVDTSLGSIATMSDLDRGDGLDSHAAAQANLVKTELIRRWRYVSSGQRERDLVRFFAVLPGGQASVVSLHGTTTTITTTVTEAMTSNDAPLPTTLRPFEDVNTDSALAMSEEKSSPTGRRRPLFRYKYRKDDPFPLNRYSLDLTSTTTESEDTIITPSSAVATLQGLHLYPLPPPTRLQLAIRALQLGWNFAPVLSTWGIALVSPTFRRNYWYRWLTQCMGQSGAAWIKWGQWSGTRHDMFPEALCDALSQLHNAAPAHPWSITETTLAQALHITSPNQHLIGPNGVFEAFDITPLASGSIAQVYKAVLDGHWIAVKVRHPHVAKLMDMDFRLMVMVAAFADSCIPALRWLHLPQSVQQFSSTMAAQSDLHVEAHHLEVLHHNFRHWPHVRFPQPFFANEAIILETFEPGRIVTGVIDMYDQLANAIQREEDDNPTGADHATAVLAEGNGLVATVHEPLEPGGGDHGATSLLDDASSSSSSGSLLERLQGHELIPIGIAKFLVTTGLAVYLKMLLVDNLMHADLYVSLTVPDACLSPPACLSYDPPHQCHSFALHGPPVPHTGIPATSWSASTATAKTTVVLGIAMGSLPQQPRRTHWPWSHTTTRTSHPSTCTGCWASAWSMPGWWRSSPTTRVPPSSDCSPVWGKATAPAQPVRRQTESANDPAAIALLPSVSCSLTRGPAVPSFLVRCRLCAPILHREPHGS